MPRRRDLIGLLDVAERLASVDRLGQLAGCLPDVASLVGAACVIHHQAVTLCGQPSQVAIGWAEGGFAPSRLEAYAALVAEHPLLQLHMSEPGAHTEPIAISQVVSDREWRNSRIYRESQHPLGCDDQIAFVLSADTHQFAAFSIGRPGRAFNEREIMIVRLVRPHLTAAIRRAQRSRTSYQAIETLPSPHEVTIQTPQLRPTIATAGLTPREVEVLYTLWDAASSRRAARRLNISLRTYTTHLGTIYRKLGVTCRLEALGAAFEHS